jgi:hypothetical protein
MIAWETMETIGENMVVMTNNDYNHIKMNPYNFFSVTT